jgi:hypothetical protein
VLVLVVILIWARDLGDSQAGSGMLNQAECGGLLKKRAAGGQSILSEEVRVVAGASAKENARALK